MKHFFPKNFFNPNFEKILNKPNPYSNIEYTINPNLENDINPNTNPNFEYGINPNLNPNFEHDINPNTYLYNPTFEIFFKL